MEKRNDNNLSSCGYMVGNLHAHVSFHISIISSRVTYFNTTWIHEVIEIHVLVVQ